jgi:hypothetical protein
MNIKCLTTLTLLTLGGFAAFATHAHAQDTTEFSGTTPDFGLIGVAIGDDRTLSNDTRSPLSIQDSVSGMPTLKGGPNLSGMRCVT